MNEVRYIFPALLWAVTALISACSDEPGDVRPPPPLEGADMGGAFELTSETGEVVSEADFAGQYRIIYFGYTFCPDVCPADMQKLGRGMRALEVRNPELAARVQPIFISVDPARDTPELLAEFTDNFHPRLIGLTGPQTVIDRVTQDYGTYYSLGEDDGSGNYLVDHSNNVVLYGRQGEPLAVIDIGGTAEELAGQIERWAR